MSTAVGPDPPTSQKYEPKQDDPFYKIYKSPSGIWRRQDALSEIVTLLEILRDSAPSCITSTLSVEWSARANCLSKVLRSAGLRKEAYLLCKKAHELIEELAVLWPQHCRTYRADSYTAFSICRSSMGEKKEALTAIQSALDIYRALAEEDPQTYRPAIAATLNLLFIRYNALGRKEEALAAIEEAVPIWRLLVAENYKVKSFRADLAASLSNLSLQLDALRMKGAEQSIRESLALRKRLVQKDPANPEGDDTEAFKPGLATSLSNLFLCLWNQGQREGEVRDVIDEAVNILRELSASHPEAFNPDLATCLVNQALSLRDVGDMEGALSAIWESVKIFTSHYKEYPCSFRTRLADAMDVLKCCLRGVGKTEEALKIKEEAKQIRLLPYHVLSD